MLQINSSGRFVACRTVAVAKEGMCTSLSDGVQNQGHIFLSKKYSYGSLLSRD
jgi:hypothetical protein